MGKRKLGFMIGLVPLILSILGLVFFFFLAGFFIDGLDISYGYLLVILYIVLFTLTIITVIKLRKTTSKVWPIIAIVIGALSAYTVIFGVPLLAAGILVLLDIKENESQSTTNKTDEVVTKKNYKYIY